MSAIHNLSLGASAGLGKFRVTRVPGGWLFEAYSSYFQEGVGTIEEFSPPVFVPWHVEGSAQGYPVRKEGDNE